MQCIEFIRIVCCKLPDIALCGPDWTLSSIKPDECPTQSRKFLHLRQCARSIRTDAEINEARPAGIQHRRTGAYFDLPISFHDAAR